MQCQYLGLAAGKNIANTGPDIAALARLTEIKAAVLEFREELFDLGAIIPDHGMGNVELAEEILGLVKFSPGGAIEADGDVAQVIYPAQFLDNFGQCRPLNFTVEAGQHQFHGPVA